MSDSDVSTLPHFVKIELWAARLRPRTEGIFFRRPETPRCTASINIDMWGEGRQGSCEQCRWEFVCIHRSPKHGYSVSTKALHDGNALGWRGASAQKQHTLFIVCMFYKCNVHCLSWLHIGMGLLLCMCARALARVFLAPNTACLVADPI